MHWRKILEGYFPQNYFIQHFYIYFYQTHFKIIKIFFIKYLSLKEHLFACILIACKIPHRIERKTFLLSSLIIERGFLGLRLFHFLWGCIGYSRCIRFTVDPLYLCKKLKILNRFTNRNYFLHKCRKKYQIPKRNK